MSDETRLFNILESGDIDRISMYFEYVYNKYKGLVSFVVAKYIKNSEDLKDIVQEVFVKFFNNAQNIKTNIKSYLTTTARNLSINFLKQSNKTIEFDDLLVDDNREYNSQYLEIVDALKSSLSEEETTIILMHVIEDYTFKEIATRLGSNENSIKSTYFRSLKKLRKKGGF